MSRPLTMTSPGEMTDVDELACEETKMTRLSIVMPVYNERRTLRTIVSRVLANPTGLPLELICVDDDSSDGSYTVLQELAAGEPRLKILQHDSNKGKGAALRTAIEQVTGDVVLIQDADLEYDPADYPRLLRPILTGKADAVIGSRFAAAEERRVLLYRHSVANRFLTWCANVLNDLNLTDMESCYKAIRADILKQIPLKSRRFGVEPELVTRLAQWRVRIYEVPINYYGRTYAEGKKIGLADAFDALWSLFRFRFLDTRFTYHDGYYILESVRRAQRFNRWILSQFEAFVGDWVLEAGCGIGNFTELLLDRQRLQCVDNEPFYVEMINHRFGHLENFDARVMDLSDASQYDSLDGQPDTIICLNVVEHLENDTEVMEQMFRILKPGGHCVILVPAHMWLYSKCDEILGHFRRYSESELESKLTSAGFELAAMQAFNRLGVVGWYINKRLGKTRLSPTQMKVFETILPVAKAWEWTQLGPALSLIAVGKKPS